MLFNTIDFVIFFTTIATLLAVIKNRNYKHLLLLGASYFFFYYSSNYLVTLLIYTTIWDFYFGKFISRSTNQDKKKKLLIISIAGNLGLLGFFKYSDFAIAQINFLGIYFDFGTQIPLLDLALPIAISFYTFHSITYTVGIYRGQIEPAKSFVEYAIFVSFFPQLVAGPILKAKEFLPQLREKIEDLQSRKKDLTQIILRNANLKFGITLMALGFMKKMFFADNIAPLVNDIFNAPIGHESFTIILSTIAFGIQIYGDFSGYSDIAIGASLILGFKIPINFNKPYFATSPSDFWRRWHISLSTWLKDYLYVPLGGNRKSKFRTYLNLAIVMLLGGLWHGASLNFIVWGILHGGYLAIHKAIQDRFPSLANHKFFKTRLGVVFSIITTQYLVFLTWIAFRVENLNDLLYSMQKYVMLDFAIANTIEVILAHRFEVVLMVLFLLVHFVSYKKSNMSEQISNLKLYRWAIFIFGVIFLILFSYNGNLADFLYFKF